MKVGQTLRINGGNKGRITVIDKHSIDIDWAKQNGISRYHEPVKYGLSHIKQLLKRGTLKLHNELPVQDPNVLFNKSKGKR